MDDLRLPPMEDGLSQHQLVALELLAGGEWRTQKDVARECGVTRRTVERWMYEEGPFRAAYRAQLQRQRARVAEIAVTASPRVMERLIGIALDGPDNDRVEAVRLQLHALERALAYAGCAPERVAGPSNGMQVNVNVAQADALLSTLSPGSRRAIRARLAGEDAPQEGEAVPPSRTGIVEPVEGEFRAVGEDGDAEKTPQ